ncbi:fungal-specific transcription factor domain-containing protein [Apodospora peruviana]|uniref:Fungal-specific transcription factor domain-containing protein n=1 Tax=Apodospora peruviana TaxID=516989 RepID=A0AAE0M1Q7_9PEZI|nr:fungal-specific transcription factor domain-containing protein [Apodospora peruviana]
MDVSAKGVNTQCWECRRRRIVCDSTQPICTKCRSAGIVCPGYQDKKPLTWLAPNKVLSRPRKRKVPKVCGPERAAGSSGRTPSTSQEMGPARGLRSEVCDVVEAWMYYNTCIYPDYSSHQLAPTPFCIKLPSLQLAPDAVRHTLVSLAINHYLFQTTDDAGVAQSSMVVMSRDTSSRLYHHRHQAIQTLRTLLANEETRTADQTIGGVYTFQYAVLQQSISPYWRPHFEIFQNLINLRGGFVQLVRSSPVLCLPLLGYWVVSVLANTTSPSHDQMQSLCSQPEIVAKALQLYEALNYPSLPCPTVLFAHIVKINNLRYQIACTPATNDGIMDDDDPEQTKLSFLMTVPPQQQISSLHDQIESFDAEEWAATKDPSHYSEWLFVARMFRSAVAVYCLLSLPHTSYPGIEREADYATAAREKHSADLLECLKEGLASPMMKRFMVWPLIVAGVDAVRRGGEVRSFIGRAWRTLAMDQRSSLPLVAREALEKFWASGKNGWDECFDVPYALVF